MQVSSTQCCRTSKIKLFNKLKTSFKQQKVFLVSIKNKVIKKIIFPTKDLNKNKLNKFFSNLKINFKIIQKVLFCSVVPKSFNLIKSFLSKKTKVKCYEVKNLNLRSLIKIKVNYNQVGSDRITNAISLSCLLYTSPSPRDATLSRMPSSA